MNEEWTPIRSVAVSPRAKKTKAAANGAHVQSPPRTEAVAKQLPFKEWILRKSLRTFTVSGLERHDKVDCSNVSKQEPSNP